MKTKETLPNNEKADSLALFLLMFGAPFPDTVADALTVPRATPKIVEEMRTLAPYLKRRFQSNFLDIVLVEGTKPVKRRQNSGIIYHYGICVTPDSPDLSTHQFQARLVEISMTNWKSDIIQAMGMNHDVPVTTLAMLDRIENQLKDGIANLFFSTNTHKKY